MRSPAAVYLRTATLAAALICFIALLVLFVDRPLAKLAAGAGGPLVELLRTINDVGQAHWYLVPIGIALAALAAWRRRGSSARTAALLAWAMSALLFLAAAIAIPGLIADLIKFLGGRPRPRMLGEADYFEFAPFGLDSDFHSFPSGHATTLFALAFALAFFLPRLRWALLLLAALLATGRLFVNAHYASDAVAGGALAGLTTFALRDWFARRRLVFARRADESIRLRPAGRYLRRRIARMALRPPGAAPPRAEGSEPLSPSCRVPRRHGAAE